MAKKTNNNVIKVLIIFFIIFFIGVAGYEYIQYGSIFNNTENFRKIYSTALEQKENEEYQIAVQTLDKISPRYEAFDAVLFLQAQCFAKLGDELSVQKKLKSLILKYPQSIFFVQAKYDLGKSFLRSKNKDLAESAFVHIINNHANTDYELGSYYYLSELYKNKDIGATNKYCSKYIAKNVSGNFSEECIKTLTQSKEDLSEDTLYNIALVEYNLEKYDVALNFLTKLPEEKAWIYLTKIYLKKNDFKNAKSMLLKGLANYSDKHTTEELSSIIYEYVDSSKFKSTAWKELDKISLNNKNVKDIILFNNAKILPENEAINYYKKIVNEHFKGDYASESLNKLFWHEYKNKNYSKAKEYAIKHVSNFESTKSAPKMNFWLAKLYEIEKNDDVAIKLYRRILSKYTDDYYAMRAYGRIKHLTNGRDFGCDLNIKTPIGQENFTLQLPYSYSEIKAKFTPTVAELLLVEDFNALEYASKIEEPFIESWVYYKKGLKSSATTVARNAMDKTNDKPDKTDKKWSFVYPCYYMEDINKFAQRNGISPYLLISIIREESFFNPLALSSANAVGLTQILPSTAKDVSIKKGYGQINEFLLLNPEINIKYGAAYLSQIKKQLDNNNLFAVAAYNAGAGAVSSWIKKGNYSDLDEFVENIPYPETRNYVQKVFKSYWNYARLYFNTDS